MCPSTVTHEAKQRGKQFEIDLEEILTPGECAAILRVKVGTLAQWRTRRRNSLKFIKSGKVVRYRRRDVLAFLERSTVDPLAARG